ncbi:hypothetical protein GALMADRAFT_154260 [Galerina marginata CBS 339.88]|uniref:Uncharacterized protein n=1 Tax=Galerina marginata (strain CBS 339.88) TaxID=685588 RepID=A0A067T810_GALM3|nr:hypothetical protein GALMADRAFT_154260 [Galerina marginata CBS 339.88]
MGACERAARGLQTLDWEAPHRKTTAVWGHSLPVVVDVAGIDLLVQCAIPAYSHSIRTDLSPAYAPVLRELRAGFTHTAESECDGSANIAWCTEAHYLPTPTLSWFGQNLMFAPRSVGALGQRTLVTIGANPACCSSAEDWWVQGVSTKKKAHQDAPPALALTEPASVDAVNRPHLVLALFRTA